MVISYIYSADLLLILQSTSFPAIWQDLDLSWSCGWYLVGNFEIQQSMHTKYNMLSGFFHWISKSMPARYLNRTLILSLLPQWCTSEPATECNLTMETQHSEVLHLSLSDAPEEQVCFEPLGWSATLWTMYFVYESRVMFLLISYHFGGIMKEVTVPIGHRQRLGRGSHPGKSWRFQRFGNPGQFLAARFLKALVCSPDAPRSRPSSTNFK